MSVDSSWDVEYYRTDYEPGEHWDLKRDFMEAHKERIPEDKLVCLAQVYANVTLMGCKYPDKTMEQVSALGVDVGKEYKEKQKERLQRTFVKASDAAGAKVRGDGKRRDNAQEKKPLAKYPMMFVKSSGTETTTESDVNPPQINQNQFNINFNDIENVTADQVDKYTRLAQGNMRSGLGATADQGNMRPGLGATPNSRGGSSTAGCGLKRNFQSTLGRSEKNIDEKKQRNCHQAVTKLQWNKSDPLSEFVIIDRSYYAGSSNNATSQLYDSSSFSKMNIDYQWSLDSSNCTVTISNNKIATGTGGNRKASKENASAKALEILRRRCHTLKIQKLHSSEEEVSMGEVSGSGVAVRASAGASVDKPIEDSSVGSKLLKMMGWSGGGLGKDQSGIKEPIRPSTVFGRQGLGHSAEQGVTPHFRRQLRNIISNFASGSELCDLAFSPDFSKDQRAEIHKIARQFKLKSSSHGKDDQRFLVLSRKFSAMGLISRLLEEGPTDKYEVLPPTSN